jgi:hypothetical protein
MVASSRARDVEPWELRIAPRAARLHSSNRMLLFDCSLAPPRANTWSGGRAALGCAKRETGVKPKTPKLGDDDLAEAEGGLCGDGALRSFDDLSSLRTKASIDRASPTQFPQQQGQPSYGL